MPSSKKSVYNSLKVLVTSGATAVAIDGTRVLTNRATGEMGRLIARELSQLGAKVTLLEGGGTSGVPTGHALIKKFFYFDELKELLCKECRRPVDLIIHAAAVSDFEPIKKFDKKIASGKMLTLYLKPTPKLVDLIKGWAPKVKLIAFKLEDRLDVTAFRKAARLFASAKADLVLVNSLVAGYHGCIMRPDQTLTAVKTSRLAVIKSLIAEVTRIVL